MRFDSCGSRVGCRSPPRLLRSWSRKRAATRWRWSRSRQALREQQRLGSEPLDDPLRGGAAVERAFGARVGALSARARRALLVAAVSDTDGLSAILQAAAQDAEGLDEAEAAGLIIVEGERLRFRHPLVRSAVHSGASGGERRARARGARRCAGDGGC